MTNRSFRPETPTIAQTNKPSHLFSFFVVAQLCVVVLVLGSIPGSHSSPKARGMAARTDIGGGLKTALNTFSNDCGRYPTTTQGIQALLTRPASISEKLWKGPYLDAIPFDPWGREYVYRYPGIHNTNSYDLYSTGGDETSKSGGDDPDDINNWDANSPRAGAFSGSFMEMISALLLALLLSPFACGVCTVAAIFSPNARAFVARNFAAYILWLMTSVILLMILFNTRFAAAA